MTDDDVSWRECPVCLRDVRVSLRSYSAHDTAVGSFVICEGSGRKVSAKQRKNKSGKSDKELLTELMQEFERAF